jgi:PTH2 family peptidyl-tRNA hydrolase
VKRGERKYKLVVVVRKDLTLSPGKMAVQVAHAAVDCALRSKKEANKWFSPWYGEGQKKVVVHVKGLDELLELQREARIDKLPTALISDAGLTEIPPGTVTCLGIGPGPANLIDKCTGTLSLF